jgi:hypothetical protein
VKESLSPFQFSMFEPAGKLAHPLNFNHADQGGYPSYRRMRDDKVNDTLHAAKDARVLHSAGYRGEPLPDSESAYGDIKERGVQEPVDLWVRSGRTRRGRPQLIDGHHRVFASNHIDPQREIPVRWHA